MNSGIKIQDIVGDEYKNGQVPQWDGREFKPIDMATDVEVTEKINDHNALVTAHGLGGSAVSDAVLKQWTEGHDYELTAITYDGTHSTIIASAVVKWPDGSAGALTVTAHDNTALKETAYTITHTISGKTVTQAAVTLNADGNITVKPALTVA
jgi:hypothetical protein